MPDVETATPIVGLLAILAAFVGGLYAARLAPSKLAHENRELRGVIDSLLELVTPDPPCVACGKPPAITRQRAKHLYRLCDLCHARGVTIATKPPT